MEKIEFENKLLEAIKKDDLKSFSLLMPTNADLNLCYGRFPILSLLYLYSSFKILAKYEKLLMPVHNFKVVEERNELYKSFKLKAKKTIRFFNNEEIIYPVLMLAVLNERTMLKHNFKFLYKNAEINDKLQKIYKIRYNSEVDIEMDLIKIPTQKLTAKHGVAFGLISFVCCLIMALAFVVIGFVGARTGLGTVSRPIKIAEAKEFISALKFGKRYYHIENDIEISGSDFCYSDFKGVILGNGHTLSVKGEITTSMIKNLTGKIENLKINLSSDSVKITQNWGIIAENSAGILDNCDIVANLKGDFNSENEIFAGVLVSKNSGQILNSEVEINASLTNSNESNAYFGGIAGINEGTITNCVTKEGLIQADTVDLAGIACQNNGTINTSENKISMNQTSSKEWHPNIGGISVANYGTIESCLNYGELNASSLIEVAPKPEDKFYVFIGGLACENYGAIESCKNYGQIFASGKIANPIIGGLVAQNVDDSEKALAGKINMSLSKANITVISENGQVCVGGVAGLSSTTVMNSGFIGTIDAESKATEKNEVFVQGVEKFATVFAGGVVGINQYSEIKNSYADVDYLADGSTLAEQEEDKPLKLYAGVVGFLNTYLFSDGFRSAPSTCFVDSSENYRIDNNFYVEKEEIKKAAYGMVSFGQFYSIDGQTQFKYFSGVINAVDDSVLTDLGVRTTVFNVSETLQEIPLEVVYE